MPCLLCITISFSTVRELTPSLRLCQRFDPLISVIKTIFHKRSEWKIASLCFPAFLFPHEPEDYNLHKRQVPNGSLLRLRERKKKDVFRFETKHSAGREYTFYPRVSALKLHLPLGWVMRTTPPKRAGLHSLASSSYTNRGAAPRERMPFFRRRKRPRRRRSIAMRRKLFPTTTAALLS